VSTRIYGSSDDLIEFDGDVSGEVGCFGTDERERGLLVVCDDGTIIEVKYGKGGRSIWGVVILKRGTLFDRLEYCESEDADPYSDVAHFRDGLKYAYAAKDWEPVK